METLFPVMSKLQGLKIAVFHTPLQNLWLFEGKLVLQVGFVGCGFHKSISVLMKIW